MMKFFRKHNKKLLAVFMVGLMIVFLGGNALYELASPNVDRVVASSKLGDITLMQQGTAGAVTDILSRIGLPWQFPAVGARKPIELIDWILLVREAKRLGMEVRPAAVQSTLGADVTVNELSRRVHTRPDMILQAMAEYETIRRLATDIGDSIVPSEADVLVTAKRVLEKVRFNAVLLPAAAFAPEEATFTDEELQAQFSKYREREAGDGLEFGYYVPPAINVQYVRVDRDKLTNVIHIPNLERRAKAFYDERPEQPAFARAPTEPPLDTDSVGPPLDLKPYLTWPEAKEIATEIVRRQEADEIASRMADWIARFANALWLGVIRDEHGYRPAPEGVSQSDYYKSVIDKLPKNLSYPEALSVATTGFFGEKEVSKVAGLGSAWYRPPRGGASLSFKSLVLKSQPIVPELPDDSSVNRSDYLSLYETCRFPVTDNDGNVFVFRVMEGREGHVPTSLDEVRDRVAADLRLQKGLEEARWHAVSLKDCEQDEMTLKEAYENDVDLVALKDKPGGESLGYFEPPPVSRLTKYEAATGVTPSSIYVGAGLGSIPGAAIEQCFQLNEHSGRYTTIELKKRAAILVVEWIETLGARDDEYLDMREDFVQQLTRSRSQAVIAEFLDPDNIRARNEFKLVTN